MIELHNIDCMEYMATLPDKAFDLAIVDPPFAVGRGGGYIGGRGQGRHSSTNWRAYANADQRPSAEYFSELRRVCKDYIIFGGNYFSQHLPPSGAIVWDKVNDHNGMLSNCEIAYTSLHNKVRIVRVQWSGYIRCSASFEAGVKRTIHPNQKPVSLYKWILTEYTKPGFRLLDTHHGSGSLAIACHDVNMALDACELDTAYYNAAVKRLAQHQAQEQLFTGGAV